MIGEIVSGNQRDWDTRVPFVMAAYRASVHNATAFTPNFLAFEREVRAPLHIIVGPPKKEVEFWQSHNDFVGDHKERLRCAYSAVRESLRRCAVCMRKTYDLKIRKQNIRVGIWVWYYYHTDEPNDRRSGPEITSG